jgi:hypothetical protein
MTPNQIAQKVIERANEKAAKNPTLFKDEVAKELAKAISEERELLAQYLNFLNESIAKEPGLVRHRLLRGSSSIAAGQFLEDMTQDEQRNYFLRLNPLKHSLNRTAQPARHLNALAVR